MRKTIVERVASPSAATPASAFNARLRAKISTRNIIGCQISVLDNSAAIKVVLNAIDNKERLCVAFVNANLATIAAKDKQLLHLLSDFLLLNDGIGIDLACRILYGKRFPANLNGTDFVPNLLDAARPGLRIYLLGSTVTVIARATAFYEARWPQHSIVGSHNGFYSRDEDDRIARSIHSSAPDMILVGMGCPRQEIWVGKYAAAPVSLAIGALFDFQSGHIPRAPLKIRQAGFEWFFRLVLEPNRLWKRYLLGGSTFLARVIWQWIKQKL